MDPGVVVAAEQTEVVDDCLAAFRPGDEVVNVAPFGGATATWSHAMSIAGHHSSAEAGGNHPCLATDVENL